MARDSRQQLVDSLRAKGGKSISTSALGRLQKTATAAARLGVGALASRLRGEEFNFASLSPETLTRLIETMGELKGVAMKAGQILSYVDGSLPPEARRLLSVLQVMSQPTAFALIQRTITEDLGARGRALLARIEPEAIASASIGQVHRALLEDGTRVAVKVRHPGIEEAIRADFKTAAVGSFFAHLAIPGATVEGFVAEAEARFLEECDYALEARRQIRFGEIYAGHASIAIPAVHRNLCGPRVLTSTWHDGASIEAFLALASYAAERVRAARALYEFYVGTLYRYGLFNADPHPGNLLFASDGRVTILDHGCVRELDRDIVTWLARLSRAVRARQSPGHPDRAGRHWHDRAHARFRRHTCHVARVLRAPARTRTAQGRARPGHFHGAGREAKEESPAHAPAGQADVPVPHSHRPLRRAGAPRRQAGLDRARRRAGRSGRGLIVLSVECRVGNGDIGRGSLQETRSRHGPARAGIGCNVIVLPANTRRSIRTLPSKSSAESRIPPPNSTASLCEIVEPQMVRLGIDISIEDAQALGIAEGAFEAVNI